MCRSERRTRRRFLRLYLWGVGLQDEGRLTWRDWNARTQRTYPDYSSLEEAMTNAPKMYTKVTDEDESE